MIKINILDRNGHTQLLKQDVSEVIDELQKEDYENKWVFINNNGETTYLERSKITEESLRGVDEITITEPLVGG